MALNSSRLNNILVLDDESIDEGAANLPRKADAERVIAQSILSSTDQRWELTVSRACKTLTYTPQQTTSLIADWGVRLMNLNTG